MSNTKRASAVGRLMTIGSALCLLISSSLTTLAQRPLTGTGRPAGETTTRQGGATTVRSIKMNREADALVAVIELDGQVTWDDFTLTGPHRVVVDVRKVTSAAAPLLSIGENGIARVRAANYLGNVRIVFDVSSLQNYRISQDGNRLFVHFPLQAAKRSAGSAEKTAAAPTLPASFALKNAKSSSGKAGNPEQKPAAPDIRTAAVNAVTPLKEARVLPFEASSDKSRSAVVKAAEKQTEKTASASAARTGATAPASTDAKAAAQSKTSMASGAPEKRMSSAPQATAAIIPASPARNEASRQTAATGKQVVAEHTAGGKTENKAVERAMPAMKTAAKAEAKVESATVNVPQPITKAAITPAVKPITPVAAKTNAAAGALPVHQEEVKVAAVPVTETRSRTASAGTVTIPTVAPTPAPAQPKARQTQTAFNAEDYFRDGFVGEPIKLDLKGADLRDVLRFISETYKVNFIVDGSVTANIPVAVSLEQVPWNRALNALLKSNRLGVQAEGNILRVMAVSAIAEEDKQKADRLKAAQEAAPLITEIVRLNYAKAGGLQQGGGSGGGGNGTDPSQSGLDKIITSRLSSRGKIEADPRTNQLIVTDIPENVAIIKGLIRQLDVPEPQVEIEARIVVANRNFARDLGVQLGAVSLNPSRGAVGAVGTYPNVISPNLPLNPQSGASGSGSGGSSGGNNGGLFGSIGDSLRAVGANTVLGLTTGIFGTNQLSLILSAQESKGNVKTIATPRITAQNNQKAQIVNGVQVPVQTESNNTVTVNYVTAALKLEITPQITNQGVVVLKVKTENNSVNTSIAKTIAPSIDTQSAETIVTVPDGGTTIIGGINIDSEANSQERTPGVSRIPGLGELFKRRTVSRQSGEILFFITPRIYRALETGNAGVVMPSSLGSTSAQK
jgi:type IV pilus assembly protein PilQ